MNNDQQVAGGGGRGEHIRITRRRGNKYHQQKRAIARGEADVRDQPALNKVGDTELLPVRDEEIRTNTVHQLHRFEEVSLED